MLGIAIQELNNNPTTRKTKMPIYILVKKDKTYKVFYMFANLVNAFRREYGCYPAEPDSITHNILCYSYGF
jgi:hypothetical protein